jgi:hypothetical protein
MGIFKEKEGKMKRDIERDLVRWKTQKQPFPLLLRGARQVGKSYIVEKFGNEYFDPMDIRKPCPSGRG